MRTPILPALAAVAFIVTAGPVSAGTCALTHFVGDCPLYYQDRTFEDPCHSGTMMAGRLLPKVGEDCRTYTQRAEAERVKEFMSVLSGAHGLPYHTHHSPGTASDDLKSRVEELENQVEELKQQQK
jgi:hypothetical protein